MMPPHGYLCAEIMSLCSIWRAEPPFMQTEGSEGGATAPVVCEPWIFSWGCRVGTVTLSPAWNPAGAIHNTTCTSTHSNQALSGAQACAHKHSATSALTTHLNLPDHKLNNTTFIESADSRLSAGSVDTAMVTFNHNLFKCQQSRY